MSDNITTTITFSTLKDIPDEVVNYSVGLVKEAVNHPSYEKITESDGVITVVGTEDVDSQTLAKVSKFLDGNIVLIVKTVWKENPDETTILYWNLGSSKSPSLQSPKDVFAS